MTRLQNTDEFKVLPALAALIGHDYNITAKTWPISILLFRLAMSSELQHKTEEQADFFLNQKYPSRNKVHRDFITLRNIISSACCLITYDFF